LGYDRVRFLAPVFIGDTVTLTYTIAEVDAQKRQSLADIEVVNQNGVRVAVARHILRGVKNVEGPGGSPVGLQDEGCIITGGGSGIGRATALLFAAEGARLVIADKHAANAQAVASQCASKGAQAIATATDVASAADVKRMIAATVERFRRL